MTLFDYDYLAKRASKCETNHFHIVIEDEMEWPFDVTRGTGPFVTFLRAMSQKGLIPDQRSPTRSLSPV